MALHNAYPRLYAQAVAAAMRPYRRHWASLFQSSTRGSTLDVPGFVGQDTQHTWNGLLAAVRMAQTASVAGEAMWGSDIGGYLGGAVTPELFARWAQFAATTPVFEVGGSGSTATFWQLGRGAVEQFRDAATLHYDSSRTSTNSCGTRRSRGCRCCDRSDSRGRPTTARGHRRPSTPSATHCSQRRW